MPLRPHVALDEKAATGDAGFVQTYYRATATTKLADGTTKVSVRYFTHVWVPEAGAWKIIGGMCREATPP